MRLRVGRDSPEGTNINMPLDSGVTCGGGGGGGGGGVGAVGPGPTLKLQILP